jgi:hypothetical protein
VSWASALKKTMKPQAEFARPVFSVESIDWARLVVIDFETYFDTHYTLKKMSTSEYVRHDQFKAQMVGIKIGNKPTKVYGPKQLERVLKSINWATHSLLCHNTAFDGFILSHHFGIKPARYYDTLSMARGLHSNEIGASLDDVAQFYGKGSKIEGVLEKTKGVWDWPKELYDAAALYCAQDVDLTLEIFKAMHPKMPADEMSLIHMTIRMFCDPVLHVDIPRVEAEYAREVAKRENLFFSAVPPELYDVGGDLHDEAFFKEKILKTRAERALEGDDRRMLIARRLLGNNEFFVNLLKKEGIEPPTKLSKAWIKKNTDERSNDDDDKYGYAFAKDDADFINLPENIDAWRGDLDPACVDHVPLISAKQDRIRGLVEARLAVKSQGNITRAERFLEAGRDDMPLPVGYSYYRAHTGRWGGNNKMNMQNLTRGGELRLSILAPYGHQMCVVDSGQIEARVNGWLWDQKDLIKAFRKADTWDKAKGVARGDNRDAYCRFADEVYSREITTEDKMERFVGKVCVLGLGFQMGAPKFQMTLAKGALGGPPVFFEINECYRIVNAYRSRNHKIRDGWSKCAGIIADMAAGRTGSWKCVAWEKETLWLPNGMALKYPDLKSVLVDEENERFEYSYRSGDMRSKIYGGLLCENIVQALARIIVATQMLEIDKRYRVVMTTHDEAVALPKTHEAERCFRYMTKCMSTPPAWCADIPLNCEGGWAQNYSK